MLKRKFYDVLVNWKASNPRKCLLVSAQRLVRHSSLWQLTGERMS